MVLLIARTELLRKPNYNAGRGHKEEASGVVTRNVGKFTYGLEQRFCPVLVTLSLLVQGERILKSCVRCLSVKQGLLGPSLTSDPPRIAFSELWRLGEDSDMTVRFQTLREVDSKDTIAFKRIAAPLGGTDLVEPSIVDPKRWTTQAACIC